MVFPLRVQSSPNPADADAVAADAAAKARIPARVVPAPNVYMRVPPDFLKKFGGTHMFSQLATGYIKGSGGF